MSFFIIGGTKRVMAINRSVRGVASKHILERENRFCLSSGTNDWASLVGHRPRSIVACNPNLLYKGQSWFVDRCS